MTSKLHEIEVTIEKERKALRRLDKEEGNEIKKLQEIEEINDSLVMLMNTKEKECHSIKDSLEKEHKKHEDLRTVAEKLKDEIQFNNHQRE